MQFLVLSNNVINQLSKTEVNNVMLDYGHYSIRQHQYYSCRILKIHETSGFQMLLVCYMVFIMNLHYDINIYFS